MPNYFFTDVNGQRQGPYDESQLQTLVTQGVLMATTLLEADDGYKSMAGQVPALRFTNVVPQPAPSKQFFCTNCGTTVSENAVACMSCGTKPVGYRKFCRQCGVRINPEQVICTKCGTGISSTTRPSAASSAPQQAFCTNCGNSVSGQAVACMSCGAKPAGHRKFCGACGTALSSEQVICVKCGAAISHSVVKSLFGKLFGSK